MSGTLINLGLELYAVGDLQGALRVFAQAAAADPHNPVAEEYLRHAQEHHSPEDVAESQDGAVHEDGWGTVGSVIGVPAVASDAPWAAPPGLLLAGRDVQPDAAVADAYSPLGVVATARITERPVPHAAGEAVAGVEAFEHAEVGTVSGANEPSSPAKTAAVARDEAVEDDLDHLVSRLRELCELDDLTSALEAARTVLARQPDHAFALSVRDRCRAQLLTMFAAKIGGGRAVPAVLLPPGDIIWQDLDHRAGFVLSQVDGVSCNDEIADITGMDRLESFRILAKLTQDGVIGSQSSR